MQQKLAKLENEVDSERAARMKMEKEVQQLRAEVASDDGRRSSRRNTTRCTGRTTKAA